MLFALVNTLAVVRLHGQLEVELGIKVRLTDKNMEFVKKKKKNDKAIKKLLRQKRACLLNVDMFNPCFHIMTYSIDI